MVNFPEHLAGGWVQSFDSDVRDLLETSVDYRHRRNVIILSVPFLRRHGVEELTRDISHQTFSIRLPDDAPGFGSDLLDHVNGFFGDIVMAQGREEKKSFGGRIDIDHSLVIEVQPGDAFRR